MSKVVVTSMISLDGCTEGRGGDVMAMPMDEAFGEHNADRVRHSSHLLYGATTYRGLAGYWPQQVDTPEATTHDRYIAGRFDDGMPITVVSDSLAREDLTAWPDQTTIVRRADAHEAVARLRGLDDDRDVLVFGSRTLWTDLLAHGLVDELHVLVGPKVVSGDHRAFTDVPETDLRLLDVRTWKDSGTVALHYAVVHGSP